MAVRDRDQALINARIAAGKFSSRRSGRPRDYRASDHFDWDHALELFQATMDEMYGGAP